MDRYNLDALGVGETVTPALGWVSSDFGWREHPVDGGEKFHNGVDPAVNDGTDVLAFADGTVDYIGDSPIYREECSPAPQPKKSAMALYMDSLGLVNIAELDSSITVKLMYTSRQFHRSRCFTMICRKPICIPTQHTPS